MKLMPCQMSLLIALEACTNVYRAMHGPNAVQRCESEAADRVFDTAQWITLLETGITCAGASGGGWSDGADRRGSGCSGAGE